MRGRLGLGAALSGLVATNLCLPAQGAAQPAEKLAEDEIVVTAEPGERTLIDRETYVVKDTPLAQTKSAVEIIRNLPSVSVDASGQLRLLGNRNVKILIDGRDTPDANVVLSNLQASRIARIEVMTNPSAQFSAYGSAGIINIILRRSFADGVSGSAVAGAGNPGYFTARLSPAWSDGKWSVSASPSFTRTGSHTDMRLERLGIGAGASLGRIEDQTARGSSRSAAATGQVSFQADPAERYDFTASLGRIDGESDRSSQISSPLGLFAPFLEIATGRSALDSESLALERTAKGRRDREELKLALSWSHYAVSTRNDYLDRLASGSREAAFATSIDQSAGGLKADYTVPVRKKDILSVGAELQAERQEIADTASGEFLFGPVALNDRFSGQWLDLSAYGTFQTSLGSFKILPGVRIQSRRFEFGASSGLEPVRETLVFPSLHLERPFGRLIASLSIARRADWPSIGQFIPYRRITGPTTTDTGNPSLRPERSLSIEAAARTSVSGHQLSLKLYDRRRSDVRDTGITVLPGGEILSTPLNVGTRSSRGGQFSIRGKFASDLRYSASAWLAKARYDRLEGAARIRDQTEEYGGNAQLEYTDGKSGESGFDQVTLNIRYQSPLRNYQTRIGGVVTVDLDYTHYLTDRLTIIASLNRVLGDRTLATERTAQAFRERTSTDLYGPLVRLSLNYRLGRK